MAGFQEKRENNKAVKLKKKKKKNETINELKDALQKEHKFYSNINTIRILVRAGVFTITTLSLFFFNVLNLDEMVFVFLALVLVEYLRYRHCKDKQK